MTEKRVLISIGCDDYAHMNHLEGAEKDARDIFKLLTNSNFGDYASDNSKLILSPTLADTTNSLSAAALSGEPISTLTIFFAGHGVVAHGSYFLCLKDTNPAMYSTTALALSHLFTIINEVAPAQCNLLLDACQAGGLTGDVVALLKPELLGNANTPGIAIFASSAADEYSGDTAQGGMGTIQLLRVLRGDDVVQTQRPYLDLVEAGRLASELVVKSEASQTPVVWGVNLFGQSRFTKNPHYDGTAKASLYKVTAIPPASAAGTVIREAAESIWALYYVQPRHLGVKRMYSTLAPVVDRLANDEEAAVKFVQGVASTFSLRAQSSENSFAGVEVLATCISLLLPLCGKAGVAESAISLLAGELTREIDAVAELLKRQVKDRTALHREGLSDLFYLPLRLMRVLGWLGGGITINRLLHKNDTGRTNAAKRLIEQLIDAYAPSLIAMSDEQTPFLLAFLHAAHQERWIEEGELVLSSMFSSLHAAKGNIATPDIAPSKVLEYLNLRAKSNFGAEYDLLSHPAEMPAALLLLGVVFQIESAIDPYLSDLDHLLFNIFIPEDSRDFGRPKIRRGRNHTFQIGHGIWTVDDLVTRWFHSCVPQLTNDPSISSSTVQIAALCAALSFPNRSPWFLFRGNVRETGASGKTTPTRNGRKDRGSNN